MVPVRFHGARLAYQVDGPPDAPALLLLQGQANSHRWWDPLRAAFATTFRTVTFDYRGTGDTVAEPEAWTTRSFAEDAAAVLDHLGVARAHVYGTSMGGRIAQWLAIDDPARVDRLVLACTTPGGPHALERDQDVRRALAQPDADARRAALLDLMYTPARPRSLPSTLLGDPTMTAAAQRLHRTASARHDAFDALPRIAAPTLVLHGSEDRMAPVENAHLLARRITGARLVVTDGGRHGFFDEFAGAVSAGVLTFLLGSG